MKIAALVLAHHKPENLYRLLSRLSSSKWSIYIHVDQKTDINLFDKISNYECYISDRISVYWAEFSMVSATLLLLRHALQDSENTHFYLMSGQCYPIKSDKEIDELLKYSQRGDFITYEAMPLSHKPMSRLTEWHLSHSIRPRIIKRILARVVNILPNRNIEKLLRGIKPYAGSSWWLLSRSTVTEMMAFLQQNVWFTEAFRYSHCADEMFFHTLYAHLGLRADNESPTTAKWIQGNRHPETIDEKLYDELGDGWHFMARKFDAFYPNLPERSQEDPI